MYFRKCFIYCTLQKYIHLFCIMKIWRYIKAFQGITEAVMPYISMIFCSNSSLLTIDLFFTRVL